jgi:hypothetical protein
MIAEKKKQLQTLLALVMVLAIVAGYTYWTNRTPRPEWRQLSS